MRKLRTAPQLTDVNSDLQNSGIQANVDIDRDAAARLGVSPSDIDNTLYDAFGQRQVSVIYEQYSQHHIVLEVDPKFQADPTALSKIFIKSTNGAAIPLGSIARFRPSNAYLSVNHQGQFPAVTLSFNLAPNVALSEATEIVRKSMDELHMPSSVQGSFAGTAQIYQASLSTLPVLLFAALLAIYIVLGIPLRKFDSSHHDYFHPALRGRGRLAGADHLPCGPFARVLHRHHPAHGHREKERHHDGGFRD